MIECRRGDRIPVDGSTQKKVTVEVGIEIGLMTKVNVKCKKDQIDMDNLKAEVHEKIIDIFDIDGRDKVLNNIRIYGVQ